MLEEAAFTWQAYLSRHRGSWQRLRCRDVEYFFGVWVVRHYAGMWGGPAGSGSRLRRLLAACVLLVRVRATGRTQRRTSLEAVAHAAARRSWQVLRAADSWGMTSPEAADSAACRQRRKYAGARADAVDSFPEDYWEVVLCSRRHLVLRALREGKLVGPIELPEAFVSALSPGVILNLQLGRKDKDYIVMQHGFCYPASAAPTLLEESRHGESRLQESQIPEGHR